MVKLVMLCTLQTYYSLLHRIVHRNDRDILWGAFWPKILLMALVRYKKFVHKNRACSNMKNKTTLLTKSCNILQIRLDKYRGIYTRVNNCGDRIQERKSDVSQLWTNELFHRIDPEIRSKLIKVNLIRLLISIWKRIKTIRILIKMILKGSKQSEPEI